MELVVHLAEAMLAQGAVAERAGPSCAEFDAPSPATSKVDEAYDSIGYAGLARGSSTHLLAVRRELQVRPVPLCPPDAASQVA